MTITNRPGQAIKTRRGLPISSRNERIGALSDGVFAIVMTLMAFQIQIPTVPPDQLGQALLGLLPILEIYAISFVVQGIYWVGHHNMLMHVQRHDRTFLWLNILFLLFVALTPWPAGLLIRYPGEQVAVVTYAGIMCLTGFSLDLMWRHASRHRHLVDPDIDPDLVAYVHRRALVAPTVYLAAIGLSFLSVTLAEFTFAGVAVLYIVPSPLDRYHKRQLSKVDEEE